MAQNVMNMANSLVDQKLYTIVERNNGGSLPPGLFR